MFLDERISEEQTEGVKQLRQARLIDGFLYASNSMEYLVVQPPEMKDCTIQKMTVARFGTEYMLSVHCIPWSPGVLDIPPVTLPVVTEFSDEPCVVDVPPVIIQSIVERLKKTSDVRNESNCKKWLNYYNKKRKLNLKIIVLDIDQELKLFLKI